MDALYDVAIIGGGPAGSTAAILLAGAGRKVLVVEREKFPRFHIGESLLPYSMGTFERLGLREKLDAAFVPKYGGEIATTSGSPSLKFYFKDGFRLAHHRSYQVVRADFDKLLLDRARECGAEVREQTAAGGLAFHDDSVTLRLQEKNRPETEARARYLIDCSGRGTVVGNFYKLKKSYANLDKFSVYAHFENVFREPGIDGTLTRLVRGGDRWFWMIPLSETRMSIGLVMDTADFKKLKKTPEAALEESLREQPVMHCRMTESRRVSPVYSAGDYSYRNTRLTGDRWMLAGDAAGFIDPIFSTGVFIAILSGEQAADAIEEALTNPHRKARLFKNYERKLHSVTKMYLRFARAWYRDEFVEVFSSPTERFQLAPAVNAVLAGNIGSSFAIWWRMQLFYAVLYLQRFFPLCPRLDLTPPAGMPKAAPAAAYTEAGLP